MVIKCRALDFNCPYFVQGSAVNLAHHICSKTWQSCERQLQGTQDKSKSPEKKDGL